MAAMTSTVSFDSFAAGIVFPVGVQSADKAIVRPSTLNTPTMRSMTARTSRRRMGVRAGTKPSVGEGRSKVDQ